MNYLRGFLFFIGIILLSSCIKHEVVPAPSFEVDLTASFSGTVNGAPYEIIKDLDGYEGKANQIKIPKNPPYPWEVIYFSAIQSDTKLDYIQIGLGTLKFNSDFSNDPTLENFTDFFMDNFEPNYSYGATNGVEIVFRDGNGNIWVTDQDMNSFLDFKFMSLSQESDDTGDYIKFTAKFDAILVVDISDPNDPLFGATMTISNGRFQGFFQR